MFPAVPSTITPPGVSVPAASAASIIAIPMRSFTDPPGFMNSALPYTGVTAPSTTRLSRISGVQPMTSSTL